MKVHGAASLKLGDFREAQACVIAEAGLGDACLGGDVSADAARGAVPEGSCVRVPEDVSGVVVAASTEGLSGRRVLFCVDEPAP